MSHKNKTRIRGWLKGLRSEPKSPFDLNSTWKQTPHKHNFGYLLVNCQGQNFSQKKLHHRYFLVMLYHSKNFRERKWGLLIRYSLTEAATEWTFLKIALFIKHKISYLICSSFKEVLSTKCPNRWSWRFKKLLECVWAFYGFGVWRVKQIKSIQVNDKCSDVSRDFLRIPFSAGNFRAGAQKTITVNFEE